MSFTEIQEKMNRLLGEVASVSDGGGLVDFVAYAKNQGKGYTEQTLKNYKNGKYGGGVPFRDDAYLKKFQELEPLVKAYLKERRIKDRYLVLKGTVWILYFMKWSKYRDTYSLGKAAIEFSNNNIARLKNLPDKSENPDKEGMCVFNGKTLHINLENQDVPESYLNIMLDISGDLANAEVLVGGYQSREKDLIMVGTLLFHRSNEKKLENITTMPMSLSENPEEFKKVDDTIKQFISAKSQNLLKIFPHPAGSLTALSEKMHHYRQKKQSRLMTTFIESSRPRVFISIPNSGVDTNEHEENVKKTNGLIERLKARWSEQIEITYISDKDRAVYDYTKTMNIVKKTSIFVFIYPCKDQILSTSFVELGWAFLAAKNILTYALPGVLPERLENYLRNSSEDIIHCDRVDYGKILKDINFHLEKILTPVHDRT